MRWRRRGKIFGIGLARTGTRSLHRAFELLGLSSIHFPSDDRTRREVLGFLRDGGDRLHLPALRRCDALSDTPVPATFEALDASYPGSRFILTVRDKAGWLRSIEAFWNLGLDEFVQEKPDDPWAVYITTINRAVYGAPTFDAGRFANAYDAYLQRVARHFEGRDQDLLVLNVFKGQGWAELGAFLDRPVPEIPFPHENRNPARPVA